MSESYFSKLVLPHEPALVYIAVDAVEPTLTRVLPHDEVEVVLQHRLVLGVLGYHHLISTQLAEEVAVVEVGTRIDERLLLVGLFHQAEEGEQRVLKRFRVQPALRLNVNHRDEVLVARPALCHEVLQLHLLLYLWSIEMVRPHLQAIAVCQVDVLLIAVINIVSALRSLQIDVSHLRFAHRLPEHGALVVAQVDAMDMSAGIFAFHATLLCQHGQRAEHHGNDSQNSLHKCKGTEKN